MNFVTFEKFELNIREMGSKYVSGHSRVTGYCTLKILFDNLTTKWSQRPGGQNWKVGRFSNFVLCTAGGLLRKAPSTSKIWWFMKPNRQLACLRIFWIWYKMTRSQIELRSMECYCNTLLCGSYWDPVKVCDQRSHSWDFHVFTVC